MHEMSLCESILRIIEKQAKADAFTRVDEVTLEIGAMAGASEESLAFCFPFVVKGTIADGARLTFAPAADPHALRVSKLEVR